MNWIWRCCLAIAFTVALALSASVLAPADVDAQAEPPPRAGCTIHVFHVPRDCEYVRLKGIDEMVAALESYAETNGTYRVDGGGFRGGGTGWTFWEEAGSTYPTAIATVLANQGHLAADATRDPLWVSATSIEGDVLTYLCQDRVAVFSRNSVTEPSASDRAWWANNNCTTYPIDRLGAGYFKLSAPLSIAGLDNTSAEAVRVVAVAEMVAALESYADTNGTYRVDGGGFRGGGTGWTFWEEAGSTYPTAIATVLMAQGHLSADATRDPLWRSVTAIEGDVLTYLCKGRVAVFSRHSTTRPSASDRAWWANNGCTTYPIDRLNATYFQLSDS